MGKGKFGRMLMIPLVLVLAVTLMATAACTPSDIGLLKGVLQNVDSANGKITIVTNDGKTVTIKISSDTEVKAEGADTTVGTLEPGASVEIKVEKEKQVASRIDARQAEVEGNIVSVISGNITIKTENNRQVIIQVTNQTRIELDNDRPGTLANLQAGVKVEAKYDPTTLLALRIKIEDEDDDADDDKETSKIGWGIVEIRVTDPPPANVKSAVVHLSNIEVHRAGNDVSDNASGNVTSSDNTSGWIPIIGAPASFDLMNVIGVEQILGAANITAGKFTQIRMDVTKVTGVTTDNVSFTAQVPGDKVKIVGEFNVGGGKKTVLTLDFDGEKSLVRTGQGKFLFKPVVKLLVNSGGKTNQEDRGDTGKPGDTGAGKGNSGEGKKP